MAYFINGKFLFSLLIQIIVMVKAVSDICNICKCYDYQDDNMRDVLAVLCKNNINHILQIDFETFEWPTKNENYPIKAFINNLPINSLPKMNGDSNVISLNLDGNNIRTITFDPFELFSNLEEISLANNRINDIKDDFLISQTKLKQLNMANNTLSAFDPNIVAHLKELQEIDLSKNFLTKITADFLEATRYAEIIRLENNKIYSIDNAYENVYNLRKFFLANNQFTVITMSMFEKLINLEIIDLSDNTISNVDENAFVGLTSLKLLDLSNNNIKRMTIKLPDSLELLNFNNNNLNSWPLFNVPKNLTELEMGRNNIDFIFPMNAYVPNLVKLDVSQNLIHDLSETHFNKLEYLDLGYNLLKSIPQNINTKAPFLKELILDGNEISSLEFIESTTLNSISLCNLTSLRKINSYAFLNLSGTQPTFNKTETCINVKISHNENLVEIEENAFYGVRFCDLDLSYNNLQMIPRNLTNLDSIENGINLQGNPLLCTCEQEWILDDIMLTLYKNVDHQDLLVDLRCQSPEEFKGKRLVQFLNHQNPFCRETVEENIQIFESGFGNFLPAVVFSSDSSHTENKIDFRLTPWSPGFIIIVAMCLIILVLFIIVGVKWQNDLNHKLARRNRLYYDDY